MLAAQSCTNTKGAAGRLTPEAASTLRLEQAVMLLNEQSPFQINLESAEAWPTNEIAVPVTVHTVSSLTNATVQFVKDLFRQAPNYELLRSGQMFTLVPKGALRSKSDPLNYTIPELTIGPTNFFAALFVLCRSVPVGLEFIHPLGVSRNIEPDYTTASGHWPIADLPRVQFSVRNKSVRDVLNALVNSHYQKAYWIAYPPQEATRNRLGTNLVVSVFIYHAFESVSVSFPYTK